MTNILAIIPARSGSKGVQDKNIKLLGEFPLIQWSIEACRKSQMINQIIVSTDSLDYKTLCEGMGADIPFLRPSEISQDSSSDLEFITHALDWLKANSKEPDFIVHIRPTTPLRSPRVIDDAIKDFIISDIQDEDFVLCEIGGTVGDIESLPFIEAIRQLGNELGYLKHVFYTLLYYLILKQQENLKPNQLSILLKNYKVWEYNQIFYFVEQKFRFLLNKNQKLHFFVM